MKIERLEKFFGNGENDHLDILRLDLPDPVAGGNKSFKLKYNLEEMRTRGLNQLVTFGGAFSNHLAATAFAGRKNNFQTTGIIRGDELNSNSNAVLRFARECGMNLVFVTREEYRKKSETDFLQKYLDDPSAFYILPEGGSNNFAMKGCAEILSTQTDPYKLIVLPVGTGATMAGIISAAKSHQQIKGIAVLEGKGYLEKEIGRLLKNENPYAGWEINHDFTFGGYAKSDAALKRFISEMKTKYDLPLDEIYSAKSLYAIQKTVKGSAGSPSLFVHTGGYAFEQPIPQ